MFCSCEDSCWWLSSRWSPIICASEPANQCKLQTPIKLQPVSVSSTLSEQQGLNWTGISWALEAHVPAVFNLHSQVFKAFSREMIAKMGTRGFATQTDKHPFARWDFCRSGKSSKCDFQLAEDHHEHRRRLKKSFRMTKEDFSTYIRLTWCCSSHGLQQYQIGTTAEEAPDRHSSNKSKTAQLFPSQQH